MSSRSETVAEQQAVVAELGLFALQENSLQAIMDEAVRRVARTLDVRYCKILELQPGDEQLLLRAGIGWQEGYVGRAHVGTERNSQAGYTLLSDTPVIVDDLRMETRFSGPELLTDHDVVSGISVVIESTQAPYGVMGAHTDRERTFSETDAHFLQSVANLIGEAIERQRTRMQLKERVVDQTADLRKKNALVGLMQQVTRAANEAEHLDQALQEAVDTVRAYSGWPVGHVFVRSDLKSGKLRPTSLQSESGDDRFGELSRATQESVFGEGEGLPGRVLATGEAEWVEDVTDDRNFPRAELAADLGVRGAFAFPVHLGEDVVAVLEFFSTDPEPRDGDLLEAMASIGTQLGRVAEREQSERRLEASEKRYRSLMETAADAIVVANSDGEIIDWNNGARIMFGYRAKEIEGRPIERLMPERHRQAHREGMERVNRTGSGRILGQTIELEGIRKNGKEFPLELSLSTWTVDDERFFASIIRDITERRQAEKALRRSADKFRTLAEESQVGIVLLQKEAFQYVNPAFAEFLGYRREELIDVPPDEIIHPSDWPRVRENIQKRLAGEREAVRYSFRARTKAGETVYLDAYGGRIDYRGQPMILGTVLDVTEKRRLEQQIVQIQEQERRRLGQDVHDRIGASLSGIAMMLKSIIGDLTDQHASEVSALENVLEQIRKTTTDTRRLSRGLNPVHLDKEGLSAALQRLASNTSDRTEISCTFDEDPSLPRLPDEVTSHLYWIAQEATSNAVRHGDPDHIWIWLRRDDDQFLLAIEDDGKGFDPVSANEGMGQHTMRYRADIIGGQLSIQPRTEGGTVIHCTFPLNSSVREERASS